MDSALSFRVLHRTENGNLLLKPVNHKEPIGKRTALYSVGKKTAKMAEIFDTIAQVEEPFYLAKPSSTELERKVEEKILITKK